MSDPQHPPSHHLMRPVLWSFGEGPTFPGYTDDTTWNGFLNVSVGIGIWPYVLRELIAGADGDAERIAEYRGMATDSSMVSISHGYTTSAVDAKWPWLFPDYPLATMMPIPATWSEMSWRHEAAPSFGPCVGPMGEAAQIWIDYADPAKRDVPESSRFTVSRRDAVGELTVIYAGDDYDAVLTHASIEALACSLSKRVAYEMTAEEWQETRLRNRTTPDNVCASHDFMGTNILMLEAWEAERGNALLPGGERERFEDDVERVNAAWDIATRCYLTASEEGARFDAWRLTGRAVDGLRAAGMDLAHDDDGDTPGRIYEPGFMERDLRQWVVNVSNTSHAFDTLFDAEAHLWSVFASGEAKEARPLAVTAAPIRPVSPPREVAFSEQEVTVTADAIERRLEVLRQRAATTAEASSEGLFLAESIRQLAGARDKLRAATQRP